MKKEIITIAGMPGSGKSSTADDVAKKLRFKRFSSGDFMRKMALDLGISLNELSERAETDLTIDKKIDDEVKKVGKIDKIVLDSRLGFHWIPNSFKVYLDLPLEIAKERIWNNLKVNKFRQQSEGVNDIEKIYEKITERLGSEKKRYMELYKVDFTDKDHYDLVIDTNKNNLRQAVDIVVSEYKKWRKKN